MALDNLTTLLGRVLLAAIFILSGYGKLMGYSTGKLQGSIEAVGLPALLAPLVVATELGGGLLILFGFLTRPAAFLLAGFCIVSAILFHYHPGDQGQMNNFMKNLAMAGGFLVLMSHGAGGWSLDALIGRRGVRPLAFDRSQNA